MKVRTILSIAAMMALLLNTNQVIAQCGGNKHSHKHINNHHHHNQNIVDVVIENDNFSTLVAAVKAADLVDKIKDAESITLFAPSNAAFSKIDSKTLNTLLEPKNKAVLQSLLAYHIVQGKFDATSLINAINLNGGETEIRTLSGETLVAYINDGNVLLKDKKGNVSLVTQTDIDATNGVVHVIDAVVQL